MIKTGTICLIIPDMITMTMMILLLLIHCVKFRLIEDVRQDRDGSSVSSLVVGLLLMNHVLLDGIIQHVRTALMQNQFKWVLHYIQLL